ncbi:MAG: hypothetical protein IT342_17380 [Candidatus Melainabacteria bacterium]|nr:hypothetical protein [Candidatus Melainabacteria bacterium]
MKESAAMVALSGDSAASKSSSALFPFTALSNQLNRSETAERRSSCESTMLATLVVCWEIAVINPSLRRFLGLFAVTAPPRAGAFSCVAERAECDPVFPRRCSRFLMLAASAPHMVPMIAASVAFLHLLRRARSSGSARETPSPPFCPAWGVSFQFATLPVF